MPGRPLGSAPRDRDPDDADTGSSPARDTCVFYISGHGFGHASRQIEIINELGTLPDPPRIVIRTAAARWLFERTVRVPIAMIEGPSDTGVVQIDSLHLDEAETIRRAARFHADLDARASAEARLLQEHDARLVISDAPPLACAAAAAAGVPSLILANFTWDWIYAAYSAPLASYPALVPAVERAYAEATMGWRLPLGGGFESVRTVVDLPFVARHARHSRAHVRTGLGLPANRPLALSSFGGYGVNGLDLARLDCLDTYGVVITGRAAEGPSIGGVHYIHEDTIYDAGLRYEDLVAAVDVVVTKPGYGIASECIANHTAMLYTSRGHFAEYDVMVAALPRLLRCGYISGDDLFGGRWREALDRVLALAPTEPVATNGAELAAGMIRAYLS